MSSKLVKKLQRDLKKSPGKAAVLVALLAVAVWFWWPLVTSLIGGPSSPSATTTANASSDSTATPTSAATSAPVGPQHSWKQIAQAIDRDPRMTPIEPASTSRDVFRVYKSEKLKDQEETKSVEPPPIVLDVSPGDAGLVLTSTIVGPLRHVARVNGKSYREGDVIKAPHGNKILDYRLISVRSKSAVLTLGNQEYELKMARPLANSAAVQGSVSVPSDSPDFDPSILE